eukprot:CAMPEP_0113665068 /NCGR_PEP_ID=MMETSP0038_2-20120614/2092_1 /TAXON_ID=2898 /ORGANISM="Cryptomonas paramecium" /LENGTH=111 /DNA_ID=CAMNT_0000580365 /DNA_START=30 /DNA_END=362 /DNA_ORIENTATION=+ /assembly_acc=CAM_ASM_000170
MQAHRRPHTVLTKDQAVEIFKYKLLKERSGRVRNSKDCKALAQEYNVNEKTVRDIWSGRTWQQETRELSSDLDFSNIGCDMKRAESFREVTQHLDSAKRKPKEDLVDYMVW